MFTGLVECVGTVLRMEPIAGGGRRLLLGHGLAGEELTLGESIAVDGACLTVVSRGTGKPEGGEAGAVASPSPGGAWFAAELSPETLARTTLAGLRAGSRVNLERSLRVGDRLGGHLVTGHVDGIAHVVELVPQGDMVEVTLEVPQELARFVAEKGSVTLSGVSLTVNRVEGVRFVVQLIPHTRSVTTLGALTQGTPLNLEVDLIARYVQRLLGGDGAAAPG